MRRASSCAEGEVPDRLAGATAANKLFSCDEAGRILAKFPDLFRFLLIDETEASTEIATDAPFPEIEGYLLSSIAAPFRCTPVA